MKPQCRICLEEGGDLFSPCLCKGSVKYVHRECLDKWLATAEDPLRCTICRATYLRRSITYAIQDCCTNIQYNGFIIFTGNMSAAIIIGIPINYSFSNNTPMVIYIGLIHIILLFVELLYGLSIACKHRLNCIHIMCPEAIIFLFLSGFVGFPLAASFNLRDEFAIISYATILLMFNFSTATLFKGITKQLTLPSRHFILPYPTIIEDGEYIGENKVII